MTKLINTGFGCQFLAFSLMPCLALASNSNPSSIVFIDVSKEVGLVTAPSWKYGGPAVADINNDGIYDFVLTNHNQTPIRLFMANQDFSYQLQPRIKPRSDVHGIALGDYDLDGDHDLLISVGGGSGLKPEPQRLYRNDNQQFIDITELIGLSKMGARGRTVRWIDVDNDGDLDFLQLNAQPRMTENIPRNILFENVNGKQFIYRPSAAFESIPAERLLISDVDQDGYLDLFTFSPAGELSIWQSGPQFNFTNVTDKLISKQVDLSQVMAVAHFDYDNDGDYDYYLARGQTYFQIANNSVEFDQGSGRLDIRDEGNISHDGITFYADKDIHLQSFKRRKRGNKLKIMPLYIGKNQLMLPPPQEPLLITSQQAAGFALDRSQTGWYLGYLGSKKWRLEWNLTGNYAWDIRASVSGVRRIETDWQPNNPHLPDILLKNDNGKLVDMSHQLPIATVHNNWGVAPGDFDNDGFSDLIVYRFGKLTKRVHDLILRNDGQGAFSLAENNGATTEIGQNSHGDMGSVFDYNLDGKVDILSGDDDSGRWHLYKNISQTKNHYGLIHVGYSHTGIDPMSATIEVKLGDKKRFYLVGSTSATHSQSLLNIAHFGLGRQTVIEQVIVTWRDGSREEKSQLPANARYIFGRLLPK
ncbi:RNA-binding protein [Saccharobesus litoralis]|uniref:RNA-binding protein n=1 Tax=Saccharobesus litoralis TaxID=2172099 RepID=A0A2S0VM61_9ALTE|nr:CRTAC1 family protein [Saccharobesus litoralis]AWB65295.1 RNA-binding protein [Saccharobesus litoralis]